MMNALPQRATPVAANVIAALENAKGRPDEALRDAVETAAELAAPVVALVNKAADGVYLTPKQRNLLFFGIHALAAARCTELCQPLLRLLRQANEYEIDEILGDTTLKAIVLGVFDGNVQSLLDACADRAVDGFTRWSLIAALTRLTFDGVIPRDLMVSFLDRFEREPLAESLDPAWDGWAEAIALLGLEEMRERLRQGFHRKRIDETMSGLAFYERQFTLAANLAAGDPALFVQEGIEPLNDPVKALSWIKTDEELGEAAEDDDDQLDDPAAFIALTQDERYWLDGFLGSSHVPTQSFALTCFDQVDGFFCALLAGPPGSTFEDCEAAIWSEDGLSDIGPDYDGPEQAEYVGSLLRRHWNTISIRLNADRLHDLPLPGRPNEFRERYWAGGFLRGVALRATQWGTKKNDEDISSFLGGIVALGADPKLSAISESQRPAVVASLPKAVLLMHCIWHGRPSPIERPSLRLDPRVEFGRKVGRNEPCPCGSGKKFKRCCGSPE